DVRKSIADRLTRGNLQVSLSLSIEESRVEVVVNQDALAAVLALRDQLVGIVDPAPLRLESLMAVRGLVEFKETEEDEEVVAARDADIMAGLEAALGDLRDMRQREGDALGKVLLGHVATIETLTSTVERDPSRSPQEIAARLATQVSMLLDGSSGLDRDRLHAEAALLATKADLREEIDRLKAHVAAARDLISKGGPVGRKLDFLAQEFNRESNTICSKSNAAAVTAAGIELKVVIDQFREQVQNLE
ncbi:YicC/YloC family endoribonuclease, partial [Rhizobium sp.]|uniref:YicC/YloC family endoribonuclease n=1 Tax=Rhizobium sp. TaxID=391 RepID=UPI003F81CBAC